MRQSRSRSLACALLVACAALGAMTWALAGCDSVDRKNSGSQAMKTNGPTTKPGEVCSIDDPNSACGDTPWKGKTVTGWPTTVLLRGEVLVENDKLKAKPGSGQFLARKAGKAAEPLGRATLEFDPKRNFGAKLR